MKYIWKQEEVLLTDFSSVDVHFLFSHLNKQGQLTKGMVGTDVYSEFLVKSLSQQHLVSNTSNKIFHFTS